MNGLMQDWPLTVDKILDHANAWHGGREVVSRSVEGPIVRTTYAEIHARAKRVSNVLLNLGIKHGDRVATLAWNTGRHIEAWYGIMGIGAVCHTLNPRLFEDQLVYIINHADDRIIFTDLTFLPVLAKIRDRIPGVKNIIVFTDGAHMTSEVPGALCYETLVDQASADATWGGFEENTAAGLCYTSGTTGNPKGVLYSHRSNFIHTLVTMGHDVLGVSATDVILPVVPMFHANAWGIAFSAPAVGAKLVMPGQKLDGASVHELLESEGVTFSAAVPTVWQMLLSHLRDTKGKLTTLKRVVIGGSAVPESIVRGFRDEFGVDVTHAWGMTETSPLGTQASPNAAIAAMSAEEQLRFKLKQGRAPLAIELKLVNDDDKRLPHDGHTFGRLKVRGPFVAGAYFRGEGGNILDGEGYFDTGDVATLDEHGFMQITDRAKDVVKSGGEWISTIEIENIAAGHPKAELAAVIGMPHPKWDERPLLLVKLRPGEASAKEEFLAYLEGKIAKWWTPDDVVFVDDIPLGATGKIDKKLIRQRMEGYVLPTAIAAGATVALAAPPAPRIHAPEPPPPRERPPFEHSADRFEGDHGGLTVIEPTHGSKEATPEGDAPFPAEPASSAPARSELPHAEPEAHAEPLVMPFDPDRKKSRSKAKAKTKAAKGGRGGLAGLYIDLATVLALVPAGLVAAGVVGSRSGFMTWDVGINLLALDWAPKVLLIAAAAAILGLIVALFSTGQKLWLRALAVVAIIAATVVGYGWAQSRAATNPPIADVATDWTQPLTFSSRTMQVRGAGAIPVLENPVLPMGSAAYAGRRIADVNAETCAAARPVVLAQAPAAAYQKARTALQAAGLTLTTDDPVAGRLEATALSLIYGIPSDLVVRLQPQANGTRIDMRAISRISQPDLGGNCALIGKLASALRG